MINHPNRKKKPAAKTSSGITAAAPAPRDRRTKADHDHDYSELLIGARKSFETHVLGQTKLFTTDVDVDGLWDVYLNAIPAGKQRQIHNCHCCRRFVQTYGGLVAIAATGEQWPVMWSSAGVPEFYDKAFSTLWARVMSARVTGVFLTKASTWGTPESSGNWKHLSVVPPAAFLHDNLALDPNQAMAGVRENTKTVLNALAEYSPAVLNETLRVLESGQLTRSEKFLEPVRWLLRLHDWPKGRENSKIRHNILWREVALAPEGFCQIKSSVIGPLMDGVKEGLPFADISRKFSAMLHPTKYQRPTSAPSAGNIAAAEKLVEKLGIERSLERRFARLDELPLEDALWVPRILRESDSSPVSRGSIFGHLKTKRETSVPTVDLPTATMTWDKFRRTVLTQNPDVMEMLVPSLGSFFGLVTAVHADAPPILKWDREEERNPVSIYTYVTPMPASRWNLRSSQYAKINAILAFPNMWGTQPQPHLGIGAMLVLDDCRDVQKGIGNCLFPETLRTELHGARSTIEAYSKSAEIFGKEDASACGYGFHNGAGTFCTLRVKIGNAWSSYKIDRWD